jgi:hypothetical protein
VAVGYVDLAWGNRKRRRCSWLLVTGFVVDRVPIILLVLLVEYFVLPPGCVVGVVVYHASY